MPTKLYEEKQVAIDKELKEVSKHEKSEKNEKHEKNEKAEKEQKDQKDNPDTKQNKDNKDGKDTPDNKQKQEKEKHEKEHKPEKEHKVEGKENLLEKTHKDAGQEVQQYAVSAAMPAALTAQKHIEKPYVDVKFHKEFKLEVKEIKLEKEHKIEKFEAKEKIEKLEYETLPGSGDPGGPVEQRLAALEAAVTQLLHFIPEELRPDLSQGALKQEPDAGKAAAAGADKPAEPKAGAHHKAKG